MSMMTHHVQVQPPVQQVVQGGCYTQPDLSQQFGTLSLQDPAFIQELQRIETQKYQNYPPQVPVGPGGQHVDPMYGGQQQQAQPVPMGAVPMGGGSTGPGAIPYMYPGQMAGPGPGSPSQAAKTRSHDEVCELAPEEVRWFYRLGLDKPWIQFDGYDSLRIEIRYRHIWQTRWRSSSSAQQRRAQSLNRYYERSGDSYSGSSDEYNFSDPQQYYHDSEGGRHRTFYNSHPPRRKFSPNLSSRQSKHGKRHYRSDTELIGDERDFFIVVRGGIYEVDLQEWKCNSIYWPSQGLEIMRGTWFHDQSWQPVDCEHADRIEGEHIKRFLGHKMADYVWDARTSMRKEIQIQHTMSFPGEYRVEWMSPEETYMHLENTGSKIYRGLVETVGIKKSAGYRIFRGYKELCNAADRLPDVNHIVFVVHGVGGVMDESTIGRHASSLRDNVTHILTKCFPKFQEQSGQRVEFFPVEWRTNLRLDEGLVDAITPQRVLGLRTLLNCTAMDIMYYTSPLFRMEIWSALQFELNRLYAMFTQRNPTFEANGGKVSIVSHSLGCVITYDVLSGWSQDVEHSWCSSQVPRPPSQGGARRYFPHPTKPPQPAECGLMFRIENLICLGSPLPVFLSLRWRDPTNTDYHDHILPRDRVKFLYNIYHPCDPVAYRIEPIFMKIYAQLEPVHIYPYNEVYKIPYSQLPLQLLVRKDPQGQGEAAQMGLPVNIANGSINVDITKMASGMAGGMLSGDQTMTQGQTMEATGQTGQPANTNGWGFLNMMKNTVAAVTPSGGQNPQFGTATNGHGQAGLPQLAIGQQFNLPDGKRLAYRMDYCVRESGNSYIAAVTSHTSYWTNKDIAFFVLTKLFPELEHVPIPAGVNF